FATVSSPRITAVFPSTTVAPPGMHASTPAASGTPVLQLPAVPQSVVPAPPVHVSVQLSTVSAAGATPMPVAPEMTRPPATTPRPATVAPRLRTARRRARRPWPPRAGWRDPTMPSPSASGVLRPPFDAAAHRSLFSLLL